MNTMAELQKFQPAARAIQEHQPSLMALIQQAVGSGNVQLVEKLMELQERHEANQARKAFNNAMAAAKSQIEVIPKRQKGHNSNYAGMGDIADVVAPILSMHGLSYRYRTAQTTGITVTCIIAHKDGHFEETVISAGPDKTGSKNDIQAIGSTITYLQRYTLMAALGLAAAKDDDGKAAGMDQSEPGKINEAQLAELIALAEECGVDKVKYCRFREIESFADILTTQFERAKQDLRTKRKVQA